MRFLAGILASFLGIFGGLLCGLVAAVTVFFWARNLSAEGLGLIHYGVVIGLFVVWGLVLPRHLKIMFWPIMLLMDWVDTELSGEDSLWGAWWIGCLSSVSMCSGIVFVSLGAILNHTLFGYAGTALFWVPFFAQFLRPASTE